MTTGLASADPLDSGLDPALERGLDLLVDALVASAERTDRAAELPRAHFAALADLGLYGMVVPVDDGGLGLRPAAIRHVLRRLGSGCGATAFAFAQHHGTTANVAGTANRAMRDRWLPALSGRTLAGIAYAHVRRPGPPVLSATEVDGGWVLDGAAPWVTSWGLAEVFGVAATTTDGRLVWTLVPAREADGLRLGRRFELSVFEATATVALSFDQYRVERGDVIAVTDLASWAEHDRRLAARPNPLCLGIGDRALALLAEADQGRAEELAPSWSDLGHRAEAAAAAVDRRQADEDDIAKVRAEVIVATQQLTAALLAAVGGRGMERSHPAQRLHREAGFYVVQAQNGAGRQAMLDRVAANLG